MNKSFELVSVSKAEQVSAVKNGKVTDALVAEIKVRDFFNDTHFYLEVGLETEENAEATLRQKVESCQTMEELVGGFNQKLRELGVYRNDANQLPTAYFVETRVAKALNMPRTILDSIESFELHANTFEHELIDEYYIYTFQGKCGVMTRNGVVTPPVFDKINQNDDFLYGTLKGEDYFVVPSDQLIVFDADEPADAIRIELPEHEDQGWLHGMIY